jgi:hypothetical protein
MTSAAEPRAQCVELFALADFWRLLSLESEVRSVVWNIGSDSRTFE